MTSTLWRLNEKLKPDGIKFEAPLCVKSHQVKDGDFEIYAPTLAAGISRISISIAQRKGFHIFQCDAKNAYPHANIDHEVFVNISSFYTAKNGYVPKGLPLTLKSQKSLYSLKRGGENFYHHF